mgnify:CR=1 FL=1
MEMVVELVTTFWQWAVLAVLVVIGFVASIFDGQGEHRVGFTYDNMPKMKPIPIQTYNKGFCGLISFLLIPAILTGFFIASLLNGSPSSWFRITSINVVIPFF